MWSFEYRQETSAQPDAIWRLWSDPPAWPRWDGDLEEVTIDGPFEPGSTGLLKPKGMDGFGFELTRVEPGVGYTDETPLPNAVLRFEHDLVREDGRLQIVQRARVAQRDGHSRALVRPHRAARRGRTRSRSGRPV